MIELAIRRRGGGAVEATKSGTRPVRLSIVHEARAIAEVDATELAAWLQAVAATRSRSAFESLFRYFAPRLLQYLLRTGSAQSSAEEFVQDTMAEIWVKAHLYDPGRAAPSTWVFTIARNLRIDRLRKDLRFQYEPLEERHMEAGHSPDGDRQMEAIDIVQHFDALPLDQTAVLELLYIDGMTHSEISRQLGLPLGTEKSRARLAFARLRQSLGID